jgi:hypothetical protein
VKQRPTISKAKKLADTWFSLYIRIRQTDYQGYGKCITCGARKHWKLADCGHFQSRAHMATRYHDFNSHIQCKPCNGPRGGGEQYKHGIYIDRTYGKGSANRLELLARTINKLNVWDLLDIAKKYKLLALEEAEKRGIDLSEYESKNKIPE